MVAFAKDFTPIESEFVTDKSRRINLQPEGKNRVWNFFEEEENRVNPNVIEILIFVGEIEFFDEKTASGRFWFWNMDTFEGILQDPLSLHKYLYAANNPVSNIDPSGKQTLVGTINVTGIISIIVKVAVVSAIFAISKAVIKDFDQVTDAVKDIARRIRKSKCSGIIGETWERVLWAKANRYRLSEILPDFIALGIPQDQWVSVNRTWIRNLKRRGCVIIDIGFDTDRDAVNIGRGQYYLLELGWTAGYPNKVSDKTIPGSNHLN